MTWKSPVWEGVWAGGRVGLPLALPEASAAGTGSICIRVSCYRMRLCFDDNADWGGEGKQKKENDGEKKVQEFDSSSIGRFVRFAGTKFGIFCPTIRSQNWDSDMIPLSSVQ